MILLTELPAYTNMQEESNKVMINAIIIFMLDKHSNPLLYLCLCFASHTGLQAAFDADWQAGRITSDSYRNGTEDGALAYKLLIQTGSKKEPFNYNQVCLPATRKAFTKSTWTTTLSAFLYHLFFQKGTTCVSIN